MSRKVDQPALRPSFCFNQRALRDFLRLSRARIDDTISQNLNALSTPSRTPFDPHSTESRQQQPRSSSNSSNPRALARDACDDFRDRVLFPAWQARSDVLNYCAGVATSPDPDDPDHALRENEDARARERWVDERLDPYGARNLPSREPRTEALALLVRNERMVEEIIRARTWGVVGERCGNEEDRADVAMDEWRRRKLEGDLSE